MSFDLEKMFGITAATAASITDHNATGTSVEGLRYFEEEIYIPAHFNGWWYEKVENDGEFNQAAHHAQYEAQARDEKYAGVAGDVEELLAENQPFDIMDDGFGVDCGSKIQRDPSLEELDNRGWVPKML